jgi:hypothetical protein
VPPQQKRILGLPAAQLPLVIFENLQSVFEHSQHFLMFESLTSRDLKLGDPLTLRINNSTTFGYVPSGPCQVRFRFICHPPTITPFCVKRPQTKRLGTGFCESKEKAQGTPGRKSIKYWGRRFTDKPPLSTVVKAAAAKSLVISITRKSAVDDRRRRWSPRTRPGGSRPKWQSCRSCCPSLNYLCVT